MEIEKDDQEKELFIYKNVMHPECSIKFNPVSVLILNQLMKIISFILVVFRYFI